MRLLLADDHTLFRDALTQYIQRAEPGAAVSAARDMQEAQDILKKDKRYDLVLLDFKMPGMNGFEGLIRLRSEYPELPIALLSGFAEEEDVKTALSLGAIAYFPKTLPGKALLRAIHVVLAGEKFVPLDQTTNKILPSYYGDRPQSPPRNDNPVVSVSPGISERGRRILGELTPREMDVLALLAQGASNKEIAAALGLQVVTVKLHVRGICRKLEVKNRTQAALSAKELQLVGKLDPN